MIQSAVSANFDSADFVFLQIELLAAIFDQRFDFVARAIVDFDWLIVTKGRINRPLLFVVDCFYNWQ